MRTKYEKLRRMTLRRMARYVVTKCIFKTCTHMHKSWPKTTYKARFNLVVRLEEKDTRTTLGGYTSCVALIKVVSLGGCIKKLKVG